LAITAKFYTVVKFVIVNLHPVFHITEFASRPMVMICLHAKFHKSSSNGSKVVAIKPKTKYIIQAAIMLFYTLQKKLLNNWYLFFKDLLPYIILRPYIK